MAIRLWGTEKLVNTTTANGQTAPVVTALQNGGYVIAWVDDMGAGASAVKFQRFDAAGNKVGAETIVPSDGEGDQDQVSICTLSNGTFVIAHRDADPAISPVAGSIALTRFGADGTFLGQTINGGTNTSQPSIHPDGTGFRLSASNYLNSTDSDVFTVRYDVNGVFQTSSTIDFSVTIEGRPDVISTLIDGLVAVYTRNEGTSAIQIMMRVGADGTGFLSAPIVLDSFGGLTATTIREAQICYLGAKPDGSGSTSLYVVALNTFDPANGDSNIGIKLVLGNGTVLANLAQIPGTLSEILVQPDQSFYLVYQTAFGAAGDIKIRHIDKTGQQLGLDVTISSNDTENAQSPSIAQLADGRFIVTWMDTTASSDGSGSGINQQIIDPRDGIVNGTNVASVAETLMGNDSSNDQMRGFAGADTMYGLAGADTMYGGDGGDILFGGRGDDTIYGGNNADNLVGELGADDIDGGTGIDTIFFTSSRTGVTVNLLTGTGSGGEAEGDSYIAVENINGSAFGDNLTAGTAATVLDGRAGSDILTGSNLADVFIGGTGADTINGLGGIDRANYTSSLGAVQINLATNVNTGGDALGDKLTNIENIYGSNLGDSIIGNTASNTFLGFGGNDRLTGLAGADILTGGVGSDTFVFAIGASGQTAATLDIISDYAKGIVGTGDKFDFASNLSIGGSNAIATATQASINATTGVATFLAGSGTTMADALLDIATRMTTAGNAAGEFAFFKVNNAGNFHLFISDGVAGVGVGANDVLVQLTGVTTINTVNLTDGDLTILT